MDIRKTVGGNVFRLRKAKGLSQEALGVEMGQDRAHVGSIERGERNITLLTLWSLSEALGAHPRDFFEDDISPS